MRYASIDVLRAVAICVMVLVHFGENLAGYIVPFAGFGAPLFALLSGVGYRLWLRGREERGTSNEEISRVSARRGLFVFGVGIAFNVCVWLPEDTFNWDVLTLIGFALLLFNYMRRFEGSLSLVVAAAVLFITPLMQATAEYDLYWTEGHFDPELTLTDVISGFLVTGYFPIFPWIAFSLVGFVVGDRLFRSPDAWRRAALAGAGCIGGALALLAIRPFLPEKIQMHLARGWTMFPPTVAYVLGTLGLALLSLALLHRYLDRNAKPGAGGWWMQTATLMSRYSFTIYIVHHLVHIWPLWIYGLSQGQEPDHYWKQAMSAPPALVLALLFLALCPFVLRAIPKGRRIGVEAWMRWLCD